MKRAAKARLDDLAVAQGLAASRTEAQALIMAGKVVAGDQRADKPGQLFPADTIVRFKGTVGRYVSRGGDKLALALEDLGVAGVLPGAVVLDIGASTGGFTDCCLQHGARHVVALDVGSNQLAWSLRGDPRVTVLEQTDVRDFVPDQHPPIDVVVADVSFNGLARLAVAIRAAAPRQGVHFLVLIKPQFELPREAVPSGGVVDDPALRAHAVELAAAAFADVGLPAGRVVPSQVHGRSGNQELFYYVQASAPWVSGR